MFNIPLWFCCLNPIERGVLRGCLASWEVTLGTFMPCDLFDLFWLVAMQSRDARKQAFVGLFWLTKTEIEPVPGEGVVCVYTFDLPAFWAELALFALTPAGACLAGCDRWRPS